MSIIGTDMCCSAYQYGCYSSPSLLAQLPSLMGKVLECYCFPDRCHGEILIETLKREAYELLNAYGARQLRIENA